MDLNSILLWMAVGSAFVTLVRLGRNPVKGSAGWRLLCWIVIGLAIGSWVICPDRAGLIAGGFWLVFVLAPSLCVRTLQRWIMQQRYEPARRLAVVLSWLHPMDGWRDQPEVLRGMGLAYAGRFEEAVAILHRHDDSPSSIARSARIMLIHITGQWKDLIDWVDSRPNGVALHQDVSLLIGYLRPLGEVGDLNRLVLLFSENEARLARLGGMHLDIMRLFVFAFCGRRDMVDRLLIGKLRNYPEETQAFWRATADMAAGKSEPARQQLITLRAGCTRLTGRSIERRLAHPLSVAQDVLTAESRASLLRLETELMHDVQFGAQAVANGRPYITGSLGLICCVMFAIECLRGGGQDVYVLYSLGALCPEAWRDGEWWRLLTSTFLHFGFIHLLMNMLALGVLGPFVEYRLGKARYLMAYLVAGVGAMYVVLALCMASEPPAIQLCVGASGSIMGLVGATLAILLRAWRKHRSKVLSRRLSSIGFIIAMQVVFDVTTPHVSFTAHAAGSLIGFVLVLFMKHVPVKEASDLPAV